MGKLWSTRGGGRRAITLLTVLLLAIFFVGVLFGWMLSSFPGEVGTIAEWIAALATIGVGYQAWTIARSAHESRLEETWRRNVEQVRALRVRYDRMCRKALTVTDIKDVFALTGDQAYIGNIHHSIVLAMDMVNSVVWTDREIDALNDNLNEPFRQLEIRIRFMRLRANLSLPHFPEHSSDPYLPVHQTLVDALFERADEVEKKALILCAALEVEEESQRMEEERLLAKSHLES